MATIDFDQVVNIAQTGINRAYVFMGLGVNCANDPAQTDFETPGAFHLQLVPPNLPEANLKELKSEFGIWIISNGLRELVDTFDVFLDRLHDVALHLRAFAAQDVGGPATGNPARAKRTPRFCYLGTSEKLDRLRDEFAVSTEYQAEIESVKKARNCLTHRLGVVGSEDAGSECYLAVCWHAPELYGIEPGGSEFVPSLEEMPLKFPPGSPVMLRHSRRLRRVPLGEKLQFTVSEIKEICYTFRLSVDELAQTTLELADRTGIQVVEISLTNGQAPANCEAG